jgi:hypothetical protein
MEPAVAGGLLFRSSSKLIMEETMKKLLSCATAALLVAGLSVGAADAKPRKGHTMTKGSGAVGGNSANSASGKNSPASNAKGSASSAGGGEK